MNDNELAALDYAARGLAVMPVGHNKIPLIKNWTNEATKDPDKIKAWWKQYPAANVGIVTGHLSGVFVLDIDPKNGGAQSFDDLIRTHGQLPDTVQAITGGGGKHFYFKIPHGQTIPTRAGIVPGVDIRGEGGQVVAPPSVHPSGKLYEWEPDSSPELVFIADAPAWLLGLLNGHGPSGPMPQAAASTSNKIPRGQRNDELTRRAGKYRRAGLDPDEIYTALQIKDNLECDPPLDDNELRTIANSIGQKPVPAAARARNAPKEPELRNRWLARWRDISAWGLGEWKRYAAGVWFTVKPDSIASEFSEILEAAEPEGINVNTRLLNSVMELARLKIWVSDTQWDNDPDILVCQNGTLHIPTKTLRQHSPQDHATYGLPFDYDPRARADTWQRVLNDTVPEAKEFIQEFAGYSLTTDTKFELAVWFFGPAGSGKSTIIEGLETMLGDRATVLTLANIERSRFALGNLQGKTLATATEQPGGFMQEGGLLNKIISGEKIEVERKFIQNYEIYPKVKILWAMNEMPRIPEAGSGIFRRIKIVEFQQIKENDRDPGIKEQVKLEGAGILNWALEGLERLKARGRFLIPASVADATNEYQRHNDIAALFVDECCILDPGRKVQAQTLYNHYKNWCTDNGNKPMSSVNLSKEWKRLGFTRQVLNGFRYYQGLDIKP